MRTTISIIAIFLLYISSNAQPFTAAELSNYTSTMTNAEVKAYIAELEAMSPYVKNFSLGKSAGGQDIDYFVMANPMPSNPGQIDRSKRVVVYVQANIHAGEVEGKEAVLMYARDVLTRNPEVLKRVVLVVCPNFNIDGNEPFSTMNRPHQNGPSSGVGVRHNAELLDLNRDAMKLETSEMRGLLTSVIRYWDPAISLDCHATNGAYREEPVSFTWMMNPNTHPWLIDFMRDDMMPSVSQALTSKHNVLNCYYGEFVERHNLNSGWISYASEPRYFTNYLGLRNRLAILNENNVYSDYKSRVQGCYALISCVVDYAYNNVQKINSLITSVEKSSADRGTFKAQPDSFAIAYDVRPTPNPVTVRANVMLESIDENGRKVFTKTDEIKPVTLPYLAHYYPTKNVVFPTAYILKYNDRRVIDNLITQGIKLHRLTVDTELDVEEFNFTSIKPEGRINQGHYCQQVEGAYENKRVTLPGESMVVLTNQPLSNLICYLLEPQSNDCLLYWNFFDKYLTPQWGRGYYPYPVYKITGPMDGVSLAEFGD
ncbi:MAG: M14 family zinc carboxypeptidase [Tenuifilaceae bacterium]|jgi:hypothetical protein|nr:M14 family zinc carboxypeptidase [Bacteroidales bacterium]MDI9517625.1 M14 family zinc carboxypeptidase [Bacteroidota bacterium]NLH57215.1 M14 family metallopeptidase [Rikenellaceae bacterium]OQC65079.1 MAG: Zinc carboxypeptidase [Bacteroidetes bacterium ADurb.Bin008]HNV80571.1 M14 family zinc carboxypeptidase [Tenuifilaceae bacterium]